MIENPKIGEKVFFDIYGLKDQFKKGVVQEIRQKHSTVEITVQFFEGVRRECTFTTKTNDKFFRTKEELRDYFLEKHIKNIEKYKQEIINARARIKELKAEGV